MASMSTPINQIKNNPNFAVNSTPVEYDPIVKGVIDEMEQEVAASSHANTQPVEMSTKHIASIPIRNDVHHYPHQQQYSNQRPGNVPHESHWLTDLLTWDKDDAILSVVMAMCALAMFSTSTSFIYAKFDVLGKFETYDMYIRALILAVIVYVIIRRFKDY